MSTIVWACVRDAIFGSRSGRQVEVFATDRGWTYTARDKSLETLWTLAPFLGRRLTLKGVMKKQLVGGFDKTGYLPRASYVAAGQIGNWRSGYSNTAISMSAAAGSTRSSTRGSAGSRYAL